MDDASRRSDLSNFLAQFIDTEKFSLGADGHISERMTDAPTRAEYDAKIAAAEARTDTKLADLRGDLNLIAGKLDDIRSGQRTNFWAMAGLIATATAILLGALSYGAQTFGIGLQSHDVLAAAAKAGAEQALAERPVPRPATPAPPPSR